MTKTKDDLFEIFMTAAPGLEAALCAEVRGKGFKQPRTVAGGIVTKGGWPDVWRANLWIRGTGRVLARVDSFPVQHLQQLESRTRQVAWYEVLRPDVPFRVEVTCLKSQIYHSDAAAERIGKAIHDALGAPLSEEAEVTVMARIDHDVCTLSVDTSGELLYKRGSKVAVNQAPMRETMAALFLQQCGYTGKEPVVDPMCGSGTFILEAAEIAARLNPGRARHFAFEKLATFDPEAWQAMRSVQRDSLVSGVRFYGSDRDAGAIQMSIANAERAGVAAYTKFQHLPLSDCRPPEGDKGLVIVNPPYGTRLGDPKKLLPLYRALGQTLKSHFTGWRVGLVTSEPWLAQATELPFLPTEAPVAHGGLRVTLYRTDPLL